MPTARSLPYGGISVWGLPNRDPPGQRPPWTETPLDKDSPGQRCPDRDPPDRGPAGQRPLGQRPPWTETPSQTEIPPRQRSPQRETPWTCDLWCMLGQKPPLWTEWHTDVKTLPCRNFVVGGKKADINAIRHIMANIGSAGHPSMKYMAPLFQTCSNLDLTVQGTPPPDMFSM